MAGAQYYNRDEFVVHLKTLCLILTGFSVMCERFLMALSVPHYHDIDFIYSKVYMEECRGV